MTKERRSGLAVVWDIVVDPKAAFAALRERPTWLWAFAVTSVLGMIGAALAIPAGQHMMTAMFQQMAQSNPQIAQMTPEKQQQILGIQLAIQRFTWLYYPLLVMLAALLTGLVILILNAISAGDGEFKRFFALAMNVALLNWGIGYLVVGLVAYLRGPDAFSSPRDLANVLPTPGWLVPGASPRVGVLLGSIGPFAVWSLILLALGMQQIAKIKPLAAWIGAVVIVFGSAAIGAAFVK